MRAVIFIYLIYVFNVHQWECVLQLYLYRVKDCVHINIYCLPKIDYEVEGIKFRETILAGNVQNYCMHGVDVTHFPPKLLMMLCNIASLSVDWQGYQSTMIS